MGIITIPNPQQQPPVGGQENSNNGKGDEPPPPPPFGRWVKYTHDRPFNDHRYAVDATKLRRLGWEQKTSFEQGLRITVAWYRRFGERWWGDITKVLSPFPVLAGGEVIEDHEPVSDHPLPPAAAARGGGGGEGR